LLDRTFGFVSSAEKIGSKTDIVEGQDGVSQELYRASDPILSPRDLEAAVKRSSPFMV
jgi:hypothetical protein